MTLDALKYRTSYFIAIIAMVSFLISSCGGSKKVVTSKNISKHQALSDDEYVAFKTDYYEANTKKILGDYDQALTTFLHCLNIDRTSAPCNYEIADILEYEKQPDSALIYIAKAVQLEPSNIWYEELYAQCLQDKGRYKDVAEVYKNLLHDHPRATDYYYKLAVAQLRSGNYTQAAQTYQTAEQKLGFNEQVSMNIIEIYERAKDYVNAEKEIQELIKNSPDVPQYYDMLGNLYEMQGKSDKAFEVYQKMEQTSPNDPMVHLSLADYYRARHNAGMAYTELQLAFKQSSLDIDTKLRILVSNFYAISNGYDSLSIQGINLCQLMIEADPKEAKAHMMYGDFLLRRMDLQKAREQYELAISEDSSKYASWDKLIRVEGSLNDFSGLANTTKAAIGLFPTNTQLYYLNGIANTEIKDYPDALSSAREGIQYITYDSILLGNFLSIIADANNALKHYKASDSAYEAALKINPNNDLALNNYSYYLSLRDTSLSKADAMSKKAIGIAPNNYTYEDTYAWILYMEKNYQDAKSWEDKSLQHGGAKDNSILEHYGDIMYKLGDKDQALSYWQKSKDAGQKSDLLDKKIRDKRLYEK